ncbi:MAG: hypothetical protein IPM29_23050 [Planctomycetes bacterium]|nr:hypothetical protein [Planctomycetota bacterium]
MNRAVYAVLLACSGVASQSTWVVAAGGGGQFTDIQPAIAAASPGDRIEVRAGSYGRFTLTKGLDIVAVSSPVTVPAAQVMSIPVAQRAVIDGLQIDDPTRSAPGPGLELSNNFGAVLLRSVRVSRAAALMDADPAVVIVGCTLVRSVDCAFLGGDSLSRPGAAGLGILSSTVNLLATQVRGGNTLANSLRGVDGLVVGSSSVAVAGCLVVGGAGGPSVMTFGSSCWTLGPGGPGGAAIAGDGHVAVTAGSELRGGPGGAPNPFAGNCAGTQGPAVLFTGTLEASADTLLTGAASTGVTGIPFQPILDVPRDANRGAVAQAPLTARPSAVAALFVDLAPGGILWIPGLDAPFVLSAGAQPILSITTTGSGTGTFQIALPNLAVLREVDLSFQVVTDAPTPPQYRLSNLGVLRVH